LREVKVGYACDLSHAVETSEDEPLEEVADDEEVEGLVRLERVDDLRSRFWEAYVDGPRLHIRSGALGTPGESIERAFVSEEKAEGERDRLAVEKKAQGFKQVNAPREFGSTMRMVAPESLRSARTHPMAAADPRADLKAFDDLRRAAFDLVARHGQLTEHLVRHLVLWAREATEQELLPWIERLPAKGGWKNQAAALVAVQILRQGKPANRLARIAEESLPSDEASRRRAFQGVIPLWWLTGRTAPADKEATLLEQALQRQTAGRNQTVHLQLAMAALGRQRERVKKLAEAALYGDDSHADLLIPGVVALLADKEAGAADRLLTSWSERTSYGSSELSLAVLRHFIEARDPAGYLTLAGKHSVLDADTPAAVALVECERQDVSSACATAQRVLQAGTTLSEATRKLAVALLATHAPDKAAQWVKTNAGMLENTRRADRFSYFAALGRADEARAGIRVLAKSDRYAISELADLAWLTSDPRLAADALKSLITHKQFEADFAGPQLLRLMDLKQRAVVDAFLESRLAQLEKLGFEERDLRCRPFAANAGMAGRIDLGLKAVALPMPEARRHSARELVASCARVGQWAAALKALELDPDDGPEGRVRTAVLSGIAVFDARLVGLRALPLRSLPGSGG
jgi:predicted DNA-binding WGR domain protein